MPDVILERSVSEPVATVNGSIPVTRETHGAPRQKRGDDGRRSSDYRNEYIDQLLNATRPVTRRASIKFEWPLRRDSYFFQSDSTSPTLSHSELDPLPGQATARFSVGQGKIVFSSDDGDGEWERRLSKRVPSWLSDLRQVNAAGMERDEEPCSISRRETDRSSLRATPRLSRSVSRSSRNLRDLVKPDANYVFTPDATDSPPWGNARGGSARTLLKRVLNWRTPVSLPDEPSLDDEEPSPIPSVVEPETLDEPVAPLPRPKPWTPPLPGHSTTYKTVTSSPRRSQIVQRVRAVAEKSLSMTLGRQRPKGKRGGSDGVLSTIGETPRLSTETEAQLQETPRIHRPSRLRLASKESQTSDRNPPTPRQLPRINTGTQTQTPSTNAATQTQREAREKLTKICTGTQTERASVNAATQTLHEARRELTKTSTGTQTETASANAAWKTTDEDTEKLKPSTRTAPLEDVLEDEATLLEALATRLVKLDTETRIDLAAALMKTLTAS